MPRRSRLTDRTARIGLTLAAVFGGAMGVIEEQSSAAAQETSLLVNDEQTANPDLVEVAVADPSGLGVSGRTLFAPEGYTVSVVGAGLDEPRFMAFDEAGNLIVTSANEGVIYRYPFAAGQLGEPEPLITGLTWPASVAFYSADNGQYLYVGEPQQVSRFPYDPTGPVGEQEVVIPDLPTDGHITRTVAIGPDEMLYLAIGSTCNICVEENDIRSTVSRANPDGSDWQIIATGLRNPVGITFQPETDLLWATVNERDDQGNEIPPDLVTIVEDGADYGWPGCMPPDATPQEEGADCSGVTPPTIGIQAHSAPLGLAFLDDARVPDDLRGDLIVAQHGSWNREPPAAPKLLLIEFEDGQPVGARDFVTGWQDEAGNRWGRPAGVVVAPDGSLIVSDDEVGLLYRIADEG